MNDKFVVSTNEIGEIIVTDVETDRVYRYDDPSNFFGLIRLLNEQQATIKKLQDLCGESDSENAKLRIENEQLKNELGKEKSLREYSDSMYGADLIVNIRFSNGEWKADVSVIDDE